MINYSVNNHSSEQPKIAFQNYDRKLSDRSENYQEDNI